MLDDLTFIILLHAISLILSCFRGSRRWSIENSFVSAAEELRREVPNCDTRLITDFRADQSWDLNQGDVLYLPPRVPHQGLSFTSLI
jgi:ribosomal protein L16 Arg81 hydroxylase